MHENRFTLRSAAYLLLFRNKKILLLKRKNTGWMDGHYSLPAGHLDGGETIAQTMSREAKEEIGITIEPENLNVVHVMHRKSNVEYIDFFLTTDTDANAWHGEPFNNEPEKCEELVWFSINELPKNTLPHVRQAIINYQKQVYFSEDNFE